MLFIVAEQNNVIFLKENQKIVNAFCVLRTVICVRWFDTLRKACDVSHCDVDNH